MKKLDGAAYSVLCNACLAYFTDLLRVVLNTLRNFVRHTVLNGEP